MVRVLCVKWGSRYGDEWVLRLRSMVAKHLSFEHEFICVTEKPVEGVQCIPLVCELPHWWQKVGLLRAGMFPGCNLYLDLDVVLTSSVDFLVTTAEIDVSRLWMRDDFSYSIRNPKHGLDATALEMLGGPGTCNSSVMVWHGDSAREAWDRFTPEVMSRQHGDQNHITRVLYPNKIGFLPDEMVGSYKYGQLRGEKIAPVMVFHGQPKMPDLPKSHPLREIWEAA